MATGGALELERAPEELVEVRDELLLVDVPTEVVLLSDDEVDAAVERVKQHHGEQPRVAHPPGPGGGG